MKLITFSLWGDDPKYCEGALRNVELAEQFYPGWTLRFYIADSVPKHYEDTLCQINSGVEIEQYPMPEGMGGWKGMFARFLPASEDNVEAFISRDCDSRLGEREAVAVQEWMNSPKLVHSMGDHPYHFNPSQALMGGMFGMKQHACPEMTELIDKFTIDYPDTWQCDQDFLKQVIWPIVQHKVLAYSDIHANCQPFLIARENKEFIGAIIGPDEERLHPEHHEIL